MISIVLPCYNPLSGWRQQLILHMKELNRKLPDQLLQYIISNDGSTCLEKNEVELLAAMDNVIFVHNEVNEGKGAAIRRGTDLAQGEIIIYTDLDFPFGTQAVVEIVNIFKEKPECYFVYGNRNRAYFKNLPFKRKLISKSLYLINRLFFFSQFTDTQAGIKGLRKEIKSEILSTKTNSFVFEIELIRNLICKKIAIEKIEVFVNPSIVFSDFSLKVVFKEVVSLALISLGSKKVRA